MLEKVPIVSPRHLVSVSFFVLDEVLLLLNHNWVSFLHSFYLLNDVFFRLFVGFRAFSSLYALVVLTKNCFDVQSLLLDLRVTTEHLLTAILQHENMFTLVQELQLMGNEDDCFLLQKLLDAFCVERLIYITHQVGGPQ